LGTERNGAVTHWAWQIVRATSLIVCMACTARAYEVDTHAKITRQAVEQSTLTDLTQGPLAGLGVTDRGQKLRAIPPSGTGEIVQALELVALGAVYEDDVGSQFGEEPRRFMRHFFDPQDRGTGLGDLPSSRQWVLEAEGDIPEQQFSLRDAHEFYLQALSRRDKPTREHNLIHLMQTIGRAVHHLQDMSQPAHTRDDIHPKGLDGDFYESYTDSQFVDKARPLPGRLPCGEAAIDLHVFNAAEKFWSDGGRGIAEFSSKNFVSQDTNFRVVGNQSVADPKHELPAFPSSPIFETVTLPELDMTGPSATTMRFMGLPISDAISEGGCFNSRAVAQSFLFGVEEMPHYSLNSFTWEANYPILFPRAIAYSVGLIDYFFRGRLRLESYSVTGNSVQVIVRNISAAEFALAEMPGASGAEFSVYYDTQDGIRHRLSLQGDDLAGGALAYGETATLSFGLPSNVATNVEKPFVLVFDGQIGNERGIAAIAVGPHSGSLLATPNYVPADGIAGTRVLTQAEGTWHVSAMTGAVAGNMDWRGQHLDDVLTWDGPASRHFNLSGHRSSQNIYRAGKVLSVAPGPVIGVAITARGAPRYLIAAVNSGIGARIYRRPYQLSYKKDGLFDPLNNPLGWRAIHSLDTPIGSHMFFNASGTEGQAFNDTFSERLKVSISGENVSHTRISNDGSYRMRHDTASAPHVNADVQPGPPAYCRSQGRDCTSRGQCTDTDGVYEDVCLVEHSQEDVTYGLTARDIRSYEKIQGAVICADYRGDVEVLCSVDIDEATAGETSVFTGEERYDNLWIRDQATCGWDTAGSKSFRTRYQYQWHNRHMKRLRIGSRTVPLSGDDSLIHKDYATDISWSRGPMPQRVIDYTFEKTYRDYDSKILYADPRYDIVVYEEQVTEQSTSGSGSTDVKWDVDNRRYFITPELSAAMRRETKLRLLGDREYLIASHADVTPPQSGTHGDDAHYELEPAYVYDCSVAAATNHHEEITNTLRSEDFLRDAIHPRVNQPGELLSLSALSQGNFIASVPMWVRQADGSYVQEGTWHHLSGGNLPALLPTSTPPASVSFSPTGIVK
jgi:hypothetical protein